MKIKSFLYILIIIFCTAACKKEGCKDQNAVNFNTEADINDGFCKYRYFNSIILKTVPFMKKEPDVYWDEGIIGQNAPDLQFKLKLTSNYYWDYETEIAYNATIFPTQFDLPITQYDFILWDEEYTFKLSDIDDAGEDIVFTGTFTPSEIFENDQIVLENKNKTAQVVIKFIIL